MISPHSMIHVLILFLFFKPFRDSEIHCNDWVKCPVGCVFRVGVSSSDDGCVVLPVKTICNSQPGGGCAEGCVFSTGPLHLPSHAGGGVQHSEGQHPQQLIRHAWGEAWLILVKTLKFFTFSCFWRRDLVLSNIWGSVLKRGRTFCLVTEDTSSSCVYCYSILLIEIAWLIDLLVLNDKCNNP